METVFLKLLNMSITSGYLIVAVLLLRLVFKKAPKSMRCVLWVMVALRLVFPFTVESIFSLIPSAETVSPDIAYSQSPSIDSGIPAVNKLLNPVIDAAFSPSGAASVNPLQVFASIASAVWIAGIAALAIYACVSFLRLNRRVSEGVLLEDNIWICDHISTAFILGIIRPRIFLPSTVDKSLQGYMVAHEKAHLARLDHIWKPLGFVLLAVYWFNPLVWAAYLFFCKDLELACDERVIKSFDAGNKKAYSEALLSCSAPRRSIAACPLAFGEVSIRERIKTVLSYKKPAFWIIAASVAVCIVVSVCFLTNPRSAAGDDAGHEARFDATVLEVSQSGVLVEPAVGTAESSAADRIWVSLDFRQETPVPELEPGSVISIVYDGVIAETYPAQINNVFAIYSAGNDRKALTLNNVVTLSQKGYELGWEDFENYRYVETGFGLYIRLYEIDGLFTLSIGGSGIESEPMYIYLQNRLDDDFIDIRSEDVYGFISGYNEALLGNAIDKAILGRYSGDIPDGSLCTAAHIILDTDSSGAFDHAAGSSERETTVFLWTMLRIFRQDGEAPTVDSTFSTPAVLTFDVKNGDYTLTDYKVPRSGSEYEADVRAMFPDSCADDALDAERFKVRLEELCLEQVSAGTDADTAPEPTITPAGTDANPTPAPTISPAGIDEAGKPDSEIEKLLAIIETSPLSSSSPQDYINEHQAEYESLLSYGADTLRYCYTEFLKGGRTGLRGHIMASACSDIMEALGEACEYENAYDTGQDWFDSFKNIILQELMDNF